jgi:hypothetical protein
MILRSGAPKNNIVTLRFFAEFILSRDEGLRVTIRRFKLTEN